MPLQVLSKGLSQTYMKDDDQYLSLSGIQHFAFCRRRWALIHIEQRWADNVHTTEGMLFHGTPHEGLRGERRGNTLIVRHMHVVSHTLGISGICDVVEFHVDKKGIALHGREGLWQPLPVEYKKGRPHALRADSLQLCAQAICLEEMLVCSIPVAYMYYGEPHRRTEVALDEALRNEVGQMVREMQALYGRHHTPRVKKRKECAACSIAEACLPSLERSPSVAGYLASHIKEKDDAEIM